jgi:diadenylate cyclase
MNAFLDLIHQAPDYLQTIKITDLIDVAIISYIIYKILQFAKKTRAGQVLRGIGLLLGMLWIANVLNLHVLTYILSKTVELGFLALVVVFQPEIRHFLEQMGSGQLRTSLHSMTPPGTELESAIDETVAACTAMSKDRIGALMVFERNSILDTSLNSGTVLDAAVSSELLKNIFWPKAPMHDGAVVVRNGRVAGAGCMLPLSGNTNISRELGMRHRAGIGVTEHTDAVAVICSEETGSISVAVNGVLKRHLAPGTLSRLLKNELLTTEEEVPKKWGMMKNMTDFFRSNKKGDSDDVE